MKMIDGLKLKDDIKFEQLEELGFKENGTFWYSKCIFNDSASTILVGISTIDRRVQISVSTDRAIFYTTDLGCFYELIERDWLEPIVRGA